MIDKDEKGIAIELAEKDIVIYAWGLIKMSVCVPKDIDREDLIWAINHAYPTGIKSIWTISRDDTFRHGEPMPCPCEKNKDKVHYLLEC